MDSSKIRTIIQIIILIAGGIFFVYVQIERHGEPDEPGSRFDVWLRQRRMRQNGDLVSILFLLLAAIIISFAGTINETAKDSHDAGYEEGYEEGYRDGCSESESFYEDDYDDGYSDGYSDGYDEGYSEGVK